MIYACFVYHFSGIRSHNKRTYSPVKLSLFPVNPSNTEPTEATQFKPKRDIYAINRSEVLTLTLSDRTLSRDMLENPSIRNMVSEDATLCLQ